MACGGYHSVALRTGGDLWAWGSNGSGQLGLSDTTQRTSPAQVGTATTWASVDGGNSHTMAVRSDGTLWAWGGNSKGQLGLGDTNQRTSPVQVELLTDWSLVSCGNAHSIALRTNGTLWAWGQADSGQLGIGTLSQPTSPVEVGGETTWASVACGLIHTVAVRSDGTLWAWGANAFGQLGLGDLSNRSSPVQVGADANWTSVTSGSYHSVALRSDGTLWAWGYNLGGQLGLGDTTNRPSPVRVGTANDWTSVACGAGHTMAIRSDGTLWAFGTSSNGQLGLGDGATRTSPVQVGTATNWASVACGVVHTLALQTDGTLWSWGRNEFGQLGLGYSGGLQLSPVRVGTATNWASVACGESHTLAVRSDGTAWAWGYNNSGQLGLGDTSNRVSPVQVGTDTDWTAVTCGAFHTLSLRSDGTLWGWGRNQGGQLGLGDTTDRLSPARVSSGANWALADCGTDFTLALRSDGTLWPWGSNGSGQLGIWDTTPPSRVWPERGGQVLQFPELTDLAPGQSVGLSASATSGLPITYTVVGPATLNDGTLTATGPGTVTVTAYQHGDASWQSAVPISQTLLVLVPSEISVFKGTVTDPELTDNTGTQDFGSVASGGSSAAQTFTLRNDGTAELSGIAVTKSVTGNPGDFTLDTTGTATTLAPGATTTFTVTFAPSSAGAKTAALLIASNDADENPFSIVLTGSSFLNASYSNSAVVPLSVPSFTATGKTVAFSLNHAPVTGTVLTVVNNTGLGFISGQFNNLTQGQAVALTYGGVTYHFVANYFGGTGNDLVLVWKDTKAWAWGNNLNGQIGDESTNPTSPFGKLRPMAVATSGVLAGKTVVAVAAGGSHSLALCSDGTLASWGGNGLGQLGNNSTTDTLVPVAVNTVGVLAGKTVVAVAAGGSHSLALCSDGTLASWGANGAGQLGNNSTTRSTVPVAVNTTGVLAGKTVVAIAAGNIHSLALCSDGTLASWGGNGTGQLGINSITNSLEPVAVSTAGVLAGKTVVAVAAGGGHSFALCSDGTLAAWGYNVWGQLGNNTTAQSNVPVTVNVSGVLFGKTVVSVAAGLEHSMALCSDGTVATWGRNTSGQLGNSSTTQSSVPVAVITSGVLAGKTVFSVAAGLEHSMALCSDGTLAAWGYNGNGQLGDNSTINRESPTAVMTSDLPDGSRFVTAHSGSNAAHSLALVAPAVVLAPTLTNVLPTSGSTAGGASVTITGTNFTGATAVTFGGIAATSFTVDSATQITATTPAGSAGAASVLVTTPGGTNSANTLFIYTAPEIAVEQPTGTGLISGVASVAFGSVATGTTAARTFTVKNSGTGNLVGLGISFSGADAADFSVTASPTAPVTPDEETIFTVTFAPGTPGTKTATLLIASNDADENPFSVALTGSSFLNAIYSSGGDVPLSVPSFTATGKTVAFSLNHAPVTGTVLTVVNNTGLGFISGQFDNLAHGQIVNLNYGSGIYPFVANYFGGTGNDLVLQWAETRLMAWGYNAFGQVGDNSVINRLAPTQVNSVGVLAGKTILAEAAGHAFSYALCSDGTIAAWGYGATGQMGNGGFSTQNALPVEVYRGGVLSGKTIAGMAGGFTHALAVCSDGTLAAWGYNNQGQLGDTTLTLRSLPVAVYQAGALAGKTVVAVAAGANHSVALCSDGQVAAWGENLSGQLGDGTLVNRNAPVLVTGGAMAGKSVVAIAAGHSHTLALCSDGTLLAWGANASGQLGDSTTTNRSLPVVVNQTGALAGKFVVAIKGGDTFSLARCSDGTLAAWGGGNSHGELGNGGTASSSVPAGVTLSGVLAGKSAAFIQAGADHGLVLCSDGFLASWGRNDYGQLGDSTTTSSSVPVAVSTISLAEGERFMSIQTGSFSHHSLSRVAQPVVLPPEIAVEQPAGTNLTDGISSVDFGGVLTGNTATRTFTVKNTGEGELTGLGISFSAVPAGAFSVTTSPTTPVAPNEETTFTVTFAPTSVGLHSDTLLLASNDADENPFEIVLSGIGLTAQQSWRQQYFGSTANSGNAADELDFDKDGLSNLLEWALGLNPTLPSAMPDEVEANGGVVEFTYSRSTAAANAGASFIVEWSDTLAGNSWSSAGVTQEVLSDNGTLQQVKATLPAATQGRRFTHLRVIAPE